MAIPILTGLAGIAKDYSLFIVDLWGVIHDGITIFPDAVDCLNHLRQRHSKIVLLSNSARPSPSIAAHLTDLGLNPNSYDWLLTSGDVTARAVAAMRSSSCGDTGPAFYHLGPDRSRPILEVCGGREVDLYAAELIICTGLFNDETEQIDDYADLLKTAAARQLPMICANPDRVVNRGGKIIPAAGALAASYEKIGGSVQQFGKPYPGIYDRIFTEFPDIPRSSSVMIGDSLATDIRGARQAGIDSIWIGGGIHAGDLDMNPEGQIRPSAVQELTKQAGERPKSVLPWLRW